VSRANYSAVYQDYLSQFNPVDDDERNDISPEMKPVYTEDADERLQEADAFKKLRFEGKQELTPVEEHADNEGETDVDRQTVSRTHEIKPTRSSTWTPEFVQSFMPNKSWKYGELDKDEYEDVKVKIEVDGSPMTFSLWHTDIRMRRNLEPSRLALLKSLSVDIGKSYSSHRIREIRWETGFSANRKTARGFQQSQMNPYWTRR
jgi:hypothetical protein